MKHLLALLLLAAGSISALAGGVLGFDGEQSASVAVYVKDLVTGRVLADHNGELALTPASVTKAVTTATVLSAFPADSAFATEIYLRGSRQGDVWHGDIVVEAVGDPTVESSNFKSRLGLCDSIRAHLADMGIRRLTGTVVVRQDMPDAGPNLMWQCEDIAWPYGAGFYGFNWRDNITRVSVAAGTTSPHVPGMEICMVKSSSNDLVRGLGSDRLYVYSRNPSDGGAELSATVPDPAGVFAWQLRATLADGGIEVGHTVADGDGNGGRQPLYTHRSMPWADIMRSLMFRSDNLFAEGMLRTLAPGHPRKDALEMQRNLWSMHGVDARFAAIYDGSGLARTNRMSAHFLGGVLEWMAKSANAGAYASFFPRAGRDGTMRGFLAKSPLAGEIALKTGSVAGVQCYAGYRLDHAGHPTHVIVVMVNGFFCPRKEVRAAVERFLTRTFPK